ncbi:MAG: YnbE family lipoprotein [Gammaproteobacteria bacterium]|jgi:hypothetical protein|nr:YnbE family lipoprotein [Gammaproteobacteria bacterium]MBT4812727.1 YnbE family lipoprotein [Thiotrichales bacterium]MBT7306783.1 YnbE family lipoprotein [Gammaproteobacteria bacterium]
MALKTNSSLLWALPILVSFGAVTGCGPTVEVKVPDKPITINLNVKIEHEVLVKIEKDVDELIDENSDLF